MWLSGVSACERSETQAHCGLMRLRGQGVICSTDFTSPLTHLRAERPEGEAWRFHTLNYILFVIEYISYPYFFQYIILLYVYSTICFICESSSLIFSAKNNGYILYFFIFITLTHINLCFLFSSTITNSLFFVISFSSLIITL
jgi:hypothetical protein